MSARKLGTPHEQSPHRGREEDYEHILEAFEAAKRPTQESVRHLMALGFSLGQARSAVYRYRERRGLLEKSVRRTVGVRPT